MAYIIPVDSVLEIRLRSLLFGQVCINTFHYRNDTEYADGAAALALAAADFNAVVWSAITPAIATDVVDTKIDAQWINPTRFRVLTTDASPAGGTAGGGTQESGTACVVKRFGEEANRHNQGRVFLFGCPGTQQLEGQWKTVFINTQLADVRDALKANIQTALGENLFPIIWSSARPLVRIPIVGAVVNPVIRYQRRREIGVGQ